MRTAVVGIDTSTRGTSAAVIVPGGREVERRDDPAADEAPRHAEVLQPLLEQALEQAQVTWDRRRAHLRRASARAGSPGCGSACPPRARSRRATTCRSSASRASRRSRAGSSSASPQELDLPGHPEVAGPVLAVIDARRGEVYAAIYRHHRVTMEPTAMPPAELADRVAGRREWGRSPMLGVGDGAVRFRAELERAGVAVPSDGSRAHRVSALMVCRLGRAREPVDRDALLPDYHREPDAVPPPSPK